MPWRQRRRLRIGRRHTGRGFIFSRKVSGGGILVDASLKCACFYNEGAILDEVVFGSAGMAPTAILGLASTAAAWDVAVISPLRALLVAAGRFGVVVPLNAFVLEAPCAVVGLEGDGVGLFFCRKIAALLVQAHVVLE